MQDHPNHPKPNYPTPKDAIVIEMVDRLGADDREAFEERAAIIEYDGQLPRAHAECLALLEVLRAAQGLQVLQIELDGGTEWLLTTDLAFARAYLADIGGRDVAVFAPADVVEEQYGGVAVLGTLG
ncbi:MAG: hypothetical protein HT579_08010 [Candidatus Accumulibacter similis]|nr:MAG: hypothetical protein HT579_08010 [Candidatus Accumulibacter similis]